MKHTKGDLQQMQSVPLEGKIIMTQQRIRQWVDAFGTDGVYVSFSGGKDSTVLLHLVREMYPDIEAVFVNTGLEYPEIQKFVKTFDNVTILRPKMRFDEVIKTYGYPMISKRVSNGVYYFRKGSRWAVRSFDGLHNKTGEANEFIVNQYAKWKQITETDFNISNRCCIVMKEKPLDDYCKQTKRKPITALLSCESVLRQNAWLKNGCNAFDSKSPRSAPMSFWTEQDVLRYIKTQGLPIASVYGDIVEVDNDGFEYANNLLEDSSGKLRTTGCDRTGCIFCGFGCHLEKEPSRFQRLKQTHPRQYEYCIGGGGYDEDGIWKPTKEGLGLKHVFDELNKIYGDKFIKY